MATEAVSGSKVFKRSYSCRTLEISSGESSIGESDQISAACFALLTVLESVRLKLETSKTKVSAKAVPFPAAWKDQPKPVNSYSNSSNTSPKPKANPC